MLTIDKAKFDDLIKEDFLELPIKWDGKDFYETLNNLFEDYIDLLSKHLSPRDLNKVEIICNNLLKCVEEYHKGFPSESYKTFTRVMEKLYNQPLKIYPKTGFMDAFRIDDPLKLYRIRNVQQNIRYERKDIFHTPYYLRSKVPTCRYSIPGYPSLYLGTSLDLCLEECKLNGFNQFTIASLFKIERDMRSNTGININVIELGIKPSDFINCDCSNYIDNNRSYTNRKWHLKDIDFNDTVIMARYLYWYPLIAACSFIRANKMDGFVSEYIVPQLLMQWARLSYNRKRELIGIRYFSCASFRASEMGLNYVFPVSGQKSPKDENYCDVLVNSFKLTRPHFINEYSSFLECQSDLDCDDDIDYI